MEAKDAVEVLMVLIQVWAREKVVCLSLLWACFVLDLVEAVVDERKR